MAILGIEPHYPGVRVDKYAIMPDHVHMILELAPQESGRPMGAPTVSRIVNQCKGYASKRAGHPLWQKLFYDHVIRNQTEYEEIWQYIDENPLKWELDHH